MRLSFQTTTKTTTASAATKTTTTRTISNLKSIIICLCKQRTSTVLPVCVFVRSAWCSGCQLCLFPRPCFPLTFSRPHTPSLSCVPMSSPHNHILSILAPMEMLQTMPTSTAQNKRAT